MSSSSWENKEVVKIAGDRQTNHEPVFSEDSKYVIVTCGKNVRVYATETGKLVSELIFHRDIVTHIELGPLKSLKVLSSSLDGYIAIWDYTDGALLKTIDFGYPLIYFSVQPPFDKRDEQLLALVYRKSNEAGTKLTNNIVTIPADVLTNRNISKEVVNDTMTASVPVIGTSNTIKKIMFTYDGKYLVTYSKNSLYVCNVQQNKCHCQTVQLSITTCATHPHKHCIATGHVSGEIYLWYNYNAGEESVPTTTKLHWHAHSVGDLTFSTDGTYLISGGEEGVLVIWQLATETKHFRPRLGAPIVGVACCRGDEVYGVGLANNAILMISGYDNEVRTEMVTMYRALPGMGYKERVYTGLIYDPRTRSLVLNGSPGQLQFFDPEFVTIKSQLEVVHLNYISRTDKSPIIPTTVQFVSFSDSAAWLATIDRWSSRDVTPEMKLKFWKFDSSQQKYLLNTIVDPPHQDCVTGLSFRPRKNESQSIENEIQHSVAVTTGLDGKFKVWLPEMKNQNKKQKISWYCSSAGYYSNLPCYGCQFCQDGSLIAVNFGKYITLWNFTSFEIVQVFNSSPSNENFTQITFGNNSSSHYLMATTESHFHMWNLLTFHIELVLPLTVDVMISDPFSECIALFTSVDKNSATTSHLTIFSPLSPTPVAKYENISPSRINSAVFIPTSSKDNSVCTSQLYFIDQNQLLYSITEPRADHSEDISSSYPDEDKRQRYHELFNSKATPTSATPNETTSSYPQLNSQTMFTNVPPHTLPPMSVCCMPFLHQLLPKLKNEGDTPPNNEDDEEDKNNEVHQNSDSESDEEDVKPRPQSKETTPIDTEVNVPFGQQTEVEEDFDWLIEFFRNL